MATTNYTTQTEITNNYSQSEARETAQLLSLAQNDDASLTTN